MMRELGAIALSLLSGLLLFVSDYPVHAWPLQAVALLPLLYALERLCASRKGALLCGLALGLGSTLPLLAVLEFPLLMGVPLALYLSLLWVADRARRLPLARLAFAARPARRRCGGRAGRVGRLHAGAHLGHGPVFARVWSRRPSSPSSCPRRA